ncbi:MAG TPA: HesA/MoeB/ThiF family protein [Acidobacteriota bacterium]|nr:HesA/MoeB/ThiF family protein [Acidobacteriota bacterium]
MEFTENELLRYTRQIMIPEIGQEGQQKIKNAKVFVAGVGGLGSISAYYLTAAGVGHLTIVDRDKVECSNLNRQIIHWTDNIGEWKVQSGMRKLGSLNPHTTIQAIQAEIIEDNCRELVGDCSIIVDAMDNMKGRRVLNATAIKMGIPYVYGGVYQLDGLATVVIPGKTACLECIFPSHDTEVASGPPGILGPVPGLISCIQSIETLKLILGLEGNLTGRLLCFCGYDMTFKEFKINKDPSCPVCGTK